MARFGLMPLVCDFERSGRYWSYVLGTIVNMASLSHLCVFTFPLPFSFVNYKKHISHGYVDKPISRSFFNEWRAWLGIKWVLRYVKRCDDDFDWSERTVNSFNWLTGFGGIPYGLLTNAPSGWRATPVQLESGDSQNSTVNKLFSEIQSFDSWKWLQSHNATCPFGWLPCWVYVMTRSIPCLPQKIFLVCTGSVRWSFEMLGYPYLSARYGPNAIGRYIYWRLSFPVILSCPNFDNLMSWVPSEWTPPIWFKLNDSLKALVSRRMMFLVSWTPRRFKSSWFRYNPPWWW